MGTKKDNENKRELAKMLYVGGSEVAEIAERVGVSRQSVSAWINKNGWKELRAARSITRPELVNKLLVTINNLIEDVNTGDDPTSVSGLADKLVKLSSVIERLDKKANIVQTVDVFMAFPHWVEYQAKSDQEVTVAFMKVLNRLHNEFLLERANVKE